ncbi:MAG: thiamine phosphate synthase [Pseudomonadota bacterium]
MQESLRFILVTDRKGQSLTQYLEFVESCITNGVSAVQLRDKISPPNAREEFAFALANLLNDYSIPLIINDHVDLALKVNAAGVHLGQTDLCPILAREKIGPSKIIGISIESMDDLHRANSTDALDYVAASSVFATSNKQDIKTKWELEGVQKLSKQSRYPVVGIGGIDVFNAASVIAAGASGIAVIGALHDSGSPSKTAKQIQKSIGEQLCIKS